MINFVTIAAALAAFAPPQVSEDELFEQGDSILKSAHQPRVEPFRLTGAFLEAKKASRYLEDIDCGTRLLMKRGLSQSRAESLATDVIGDLYCSKETAAPSRALVKTAIGRRYVDACRRVAPEQLESGRLGSIEDRHQWDPAAIAEHSELKARIQKAEAVWVSQLDLTRIEARIWHALGGIDGLRGMRRPVYNLASAGFSRHALEKAYDSMRLRYVREVVRPVDREIGDQLLKGHALRLRANGPKNRRVNLRSKLHGKMWTPVVLLSMVTSILAGADAAAAGGYREETTEWDYGRVAIALSLFAASLILLRRGAPGWFASTAFYAGLLVACRASQTSIHEYAPIESPLGRRHPEPDFQGIRDRRLPALWTPVPTENAALALDGRSGPS
ncbi:MAG: hypothetical protein AAFU73_04910 [Planctomycetota bacterium]